MIYLMQSSRFKIFYLRFIVQNITQPVLLRNCCGWNKPNKMSYNLCGFNTIIIFHNTVVSGNVIKNYSDNHMVGYCSESYIVLIKIYSQKCICIHTYHISLLCCIWNVMYIKQRKITHKESIFITYND